MICLLVISIECMSLQTDGMSFMVNADKKTDYDVKVSGVEISPYPVQRGKAATFSISASTSRSKYSE